MEEPTAGCMLSVLSGGVVVGVGLVGWGCVSCGLVGWDRGGCCVVLSAGAGSCVVRGFLLYVVDRHWWCECGRNAGLGCGMSCALEVGGD